MLGTSPIQARYTEHSLYNPANRAGKDTKGKVQPFSPNRRRKKKSANIQIIAHNVFKLDGGKIQELVKAEFLFV